MYNLDKNGGYDSHVHFTLQISPEVYVHWYHCYKHPHMYMKTANVEIYVWSKILNLKLLKVLYKDALIKLNYRVRFFFCPREQIERLKAQSSSLFRISKYWLFTGNIQFIKQKNNIHSKQSWSLTFKFYALTYWDWLKILFKKPKTNNWRQQINYWYLNILFIATAVILLCWGLITF